MSSPPGPRGPEEDDELAEELQEMMAAAASPASVKRRVSQKSPSHYAIQRLIADDQGEKASWWLDAAGRAAHIISQQQDVPLKFQLSVAKSKVLDTVDLHTRDLLASQTDVKGCKDALDGAMWHVRASCLRHPDRVEGCPLPYDVDMDLCLELWVFHRQAGTKIQILENVITGNIQEVTVAALNENDQFDTRVLHCNTDDTGYGGARRFRGWSLA
eukprot:s3536_g8.t1